MIPAPRNAPPGFDWIVQVKTWELIDNSIAVNVQTAKGKQARIIFRVINPWIWQFIFFPPDVKYDTMDEIVKPIVDKKIKLNLTDNDGFLRITGSRLTLLISKGPWSFSFQDKKDNDLVRENPGDIDGLGQPFVQNLGYIEQEGQINTVTESFHLKPDEHLYGLGEKFTRLDKVGQKIVTWTMDALGSTSERSHKNIPLLISTRGYGLFLNSSARITWELGTESTQSYSIFQESPFLDAYLIYGPKPAIILSRYADLTGHAPVPPKWSFGLWISSAGTYRDQKSVMKLSDGIEQHSIPADVLHIDTWWMRRRKYCDFIWDRHAFPEVEELIQNLKQKKLKLSLWIQPYISIESELFEIGKQRGYFLKRPDGDVYVIDYGLSLAPVPDGIVRLAEDKQGWNAPVALVDYTNPEAYRWFQDLARPVMKMGANVYKTDFGEDVPEDAVFYNGQTGATMHNLYPLLYNKAIFEVVQQEKSHGLVWARSGFAGSQKFPVCWSGDPAVDWDSLAATIRGGLSLAFSGIPFWSNDIGGYRGIPSLELYVRWAQFGLFCSHSRMHGDSPREPWFFGETALRIVRKYIHLRYRLFLYLYSTAIESHRTGMPVIRPMPLLFPEDPNCHSLDLQYMFGPWLLVAPMYNDFDSRWIYLPKGKWIDFFNGKIFEGPANIWYKAPLSKLPLFVRSGAILPMMRKSFRIPKGRINPLIVEVFPAENTNYELWEDEGKTVFHCSKSEKEIILRITGKFVRNYILHFRTIKNIKEARIETEGKLKLVDKLKIKNIRNGIELSLNRIKEAKIIFDTGV